MSVENNSNLFEDIELQILGEITEGSYQMKWEPNLENIIISKIESNAKSEFEKVQRKSLRDFQKVNIVNVFKSLMDRGTSNYNLSTSYLKLKKFYRAKRKGYWQDM